MTMLYLGNYASVSDYEDDCAADMAHPVGLLLEGRSPAHIQALLDAAWGDNWYEDGDEPEPDRDWKTDGWNGTNDDNGSQEWWSDALEVVVVLRSIKPP